MDKHQKTQTLLAELKQAMLDATLWGNVVPSAEALASTQPFCCDTLSFEAWLQFIFVPRMQALLDAKAELPSSIAICPMGEEAFKPLGDTATPVIDVLSDIDLVLSGKYTRSTPSLKR